jgi:hypothetical protein
MSDAALYSLTRVIQDAIDQLSGDPRNRDLVARMRQIQLRLTNSAQRSQER